MNLTSQTVADVIRESRQPKLANALPARLVERVQNGCSRLDPSIYRGGMTAYKSKSIVQEPSYKLHDRLDRNSESLDSALGRDRLQIDQNFGNDSFEDLVQQYLNNEGDELVQYLSAQVN